MAYAFYYLLFLCINLIDPDIALESMLIELGEARGMAMGIRSRISQNMTGFDEKQILVARIFDNIATELQTASVAVRATNFDTQSSIHRELSFTEGRDDCEIEKEWYKGNLSLVYMCGDRSNGYLIDVDPDNYRVISLSTEQFGGIVYELEQIIDEFYGSSF